MAGRFSFLTKRFFLFLNILAAAVFLLVCYVPYLDPARWWFISFLGFGFLFILTIVLLFVFFWLLFRPRYVFISLVALLLGWRGITVFFAFNRADAFREEKPKDILRVAHWNVARFVELRRNNNKGSRTRLKMMELISRQNADVLCLQEFYQSTDPGFYNNLSYVKNKLGYPYYYFSWDIDGGTQWAGQVIFSKFPILNSGITWFPKPGRPESLIYADIRFRQDTVRFFTTHLQSVQFKKRDFETIQKIKNREDSILENSKNIFSKLRSATTIRPEQARIVQTLVSQSPHPLVLTGDFNDVPNSYTYFTIRKGLNDAFLEKGFGIGRTYPFIAPTLRIDYIFSSKELAVQQFKREMNDYSDHYMLVTDLRLPTN
ncbi:endonuclease/exonuclease/phosphatase family protein [Paraflavisolibacter sp. H34]|uniref:endonuclease/exonuclease/phosphatase family protein n=1 Tax=Huijunlia imazamoxiresistens TaxID=3127457 RepID=UPI003016FBF7